MTPFRLALMNLLHDRVRSMVSITGSAFAVLLIFMQYGFLGALQNTATLLYDRLNFDLLITSSEYLEMSRPDEIQRSILARAEATPGVEAVLPLSIQQALWRNPTDDPVKGKKRWQITMLGVNPGRLDQTFLPSDTGLFPTVAEQSQAKQDLSRLETVYLDRRSRPDFGDPAEMPPGTMIELTGETVELAGYFDLGTGFSYTGLTMTNEESFSKHTHMSSDAVSFGLVQLKPDEDPNAVARVMRQRLPASVLVFTREGINKQEQTFWVEKTAIGLFFNAGVMLALFVGAIFVYQMMVADIKKHLPEYATLKAMGHRFHYLFRVVVWQAIFLAMGGYIGGLIGAYILYDLARKVAYLPIAMTSDRLLLVLLLTLGMCIGSALIAVRKLRTADPADLF